MKNFFGLVVALLIFFAGQGAKATVTFSVLTKLGESPNGFAPNTAIQGSDGNIYGTTASGGTAADGTVYELTTGGTLTTLHSFTGASDGSAPAGPLVEGTDGNFYGTTSTGGANQAGTFFRITPGPGGTLTTLHTFNGTTEGAAPSLLVLGTDGNFYGTSPFAGSSGTGAILQITTAGTVSILHTFVAGTEGKSPNPNIVEGSDGAFYGSTQAGGSTTFGTLFRVTTAGSLSVIGNLASSSDVPILTTLGNDGNLYGYLITPGSIFKMTNAGVRTTVYTFTDQDDGGDPSAFVQGSDGNFYGTTTRFGVNGFGTFFQIPVQGGILGTFQTLLAFPSTVGGLVQLVEGTDGNYYATGAVGGVGNGGTILQLTTAGVSTTIFTFSQPGNNPVAALLQASDGNLYGTTESGGATDDGTVFQVTLTGSFAPLADFNFATTGSRPIAPVVQDPTTGNFFVTTFTGGPNFDPVLNLGGAIDSLALPSASASSSLVHEALLGDPGEEAPPEEESPDDIIQKILLTIFGIDNTKIGFAEQQLGLEYSFHPPPTIPGGNAVSALVRPDATATTGTSTTPIFGVGAFGGDNNEGVFLDFNSDGSINTSYSFGDQTTDGSGPESKVVSDSSGNLYGTTVSGGTAGLGTIYKITPATGTTFSTLTTIHSFVASTGSSPANNDLVVGTDGNIYGTTTAGGANGGGVVFQMTPAGVFKVLHSFQSPSVVGFDGSEPHAGLIQASDGNFYGTTMLGGDDGVGTVFSITPKGVLTILHSFDGHDGFQPQAALIEATDGNLYGVTAGGSFNGGVIFKIDAGLPIPPGTTAQTITFPAIANQTLGTGPVALGATASSGLTVTYTVSGPATLSGSTLTLTGVGTVKVTASQSGNSTFKAATPVAVSFTVGKGTQTITFPAVADQTFGEAAFTLPNPPTATSHLAVTLKVLSGPATISGTKVTLTGAGVVTLAANQAGNANFTAAPQVTSSILVDKASQTIAAFAAISTQNDGEPAFAIVVPKASSGLVVTLSVKSGPATISGTKVTVNGVGTVVLAADQAGNANFNAAPEITTSFTVNAAKQTIAPFAVIAAKTVSSAPFTITPPKASSGLPVTVTVLSGPASISSDIVTVNGAGTVVLAANQAGTTNFAPAAQVTTSFVVNGLAQTITAFPKITTQTFGEAPFAITPPTASSGLTVSVTVKSGPATISGDTVTLTGAGTVVLAADQGGNSEFNPAKEVTTSFAVAKAAQTVAAFSPVSSQTFGTAPFAITPPAASSGLTVTVTVKSGPAKITNGVVTLAGVGTVVLEATQAGNANFNAATAVTTSFTVTKGSQTIAAFATIPSKTFGEPAFTVAAPAASSGLPVTVTVLSGPAKLLRGELTVTGVGAVTLAANQAGNADFSAATQVTTSFTVDQASQTIAAFKTVPAKVFGVAPFAVAAPAATSKLPVVVSVLSGPATFANGKVTVTGVGTVVLAANQAGNADFDAAPEVTTSFTVGKASQTIAAFARIAAKTSASAPFAITLPKASSGLPVTVTVKSGPATISGVTVTLTGSGTVVLAADQAGNDDFNAAPEVTTSLVVR